MVSPIRSVVPTARSFIINLSVTYSYPSVSRPWEGQEKKLQEAHQHWMNITIKPTTG
jgi:hypothetical protein